MGHEDISRKNEKKESKPMVHGEMKKGSLDPPKSENNKKPPKLRGSK